MGRWRTRRSGRIEVGTELRWTMPRRSGFGCCPGCREPLQHRPTVALWCARWQELGWPTMMPKWCRKCAARQAERAARGCAPGSETEAALMRLRDALEGKTPQGAGRGATARHAAKMSSIARRRTIERARKFGTGM